MENIYKYTFQINEEGIRDYNLAQLKTSQELINLIYKISGKITLRNPYKTNFTLSHKLETWLVSSITRDTNNNSNNAHINNQPSHIYQNIYLNT